ncbi:hypothetical protein ASL14_26200 (plasmid) [Paenibacillus sp. IHB B 3084]|nr:hypothetical protein ASL14_26200 [Paenibacillus sp. IHB B 3084]
MEIKEERKPNRLIHEKPPYLLQHAYNPIDWYSWGSEAFEKAKWENKPIFLSVGYSTCHWCHVPKIHLLKQGFYLRNIAIAVERKKSIRLAPAIKTAAAVDE